MQKSMVVVVSSLSFPVLKIPEVNRSVRQPCRTFRLGGQGLPFAIHPRRRGLKGCLEGFLDVRSGGSDSLPILSRGMLDQGAASRLRAAVTGSFSFRGADGLASTRSRGKFPSSLSTAMTERARASASPTSSVSGTVSVRTRRM